MKEPITKVVATGVSITVGLANDRQITFQSGFEGDETDAAVNARFDRIMALADRQKARYELPEMEDDYAKHRRTLANFLEDKERIEIEHTRAQAARRVELDELARLRETEKAEANAKVNDEVLAIQERRKEEWDAGQQEHQRAGKLSGYKPVGSRKVNIDRIDSALDKLKVIREAQTEQIDLDFDGRTSALQAEITKADADREAHKANLALSIRRYEEVSVELEAKLAKARALTGG